MRAARDKLLSGSAHTRSFHCYDALHEELEKLSEQERRSIAAIIRDACADYALWRDSLPESIGLPIEDTEVVSY